MKNLLLIIAIWVQTAGVVNSQKIYKPPMSPEAAFTQEFGENVIQVQYARPSARGRKIFGNLVPFDTLWRTGAKDCTSFYVSGSIEFSGQKLDSGKYSLFTIPGEKEWVVILNRDFEMHGTDLYNRDKDVLRTRIIPIHSETYYETFTIDITDFDLYGSANLVLSWENTKIKIPLQHPLYKNQPNSKEDTSSMQIVKTKDPIAMEHSVPAKGTSSPSSVNKNSPIINSPASSDPPKSNSQNVPLSSQLKPVLDGYYSLKDALVSDNANLASEKATVLQKALAAISTLGWSSDQITIYSPTLQKSLQMDAASIKENSKKIEIQRKYFTTLSENISKLVKGLKINTAPAYLQFCPMANGGKGAYWLSKENKVLNPYYGKQMLTCGSVKEVYQ
jgi:hypothetical protein